MTADNPRSGEALAAPQKTPVLRTQSVQPEARLQLTDFTKEVRALLGPKSVGVEPFLNDAQLLVDQIFPESGPSLLSAKEHAERQKHLEQVFDRLEDLLEAFTLPARKQV